MNLCDFLTDIEGNLRRTSYYRQGISLLYIQVNTRLHLNKSLAKSTIMKR